ncbi:MAG TPA: DUF72 domain-containing protein [Thermodesulfobacteriota bacterium]|nr:DUF72 domain-containing protein [Thermodesulfobacteriota bacterium]
MNENKSIHIGTSGWHYKHWRGSFYPQSLSTGDFLEYYVERFHTVEINNSFYKLPEEKTLIDWCDTVPEEFIFSVKANRFITHMKKLKDPEQPVATLLKRVELLGDRLGPILFQLPPRWHLNYERFKSFLETLPGGYKYTFEFRDPTWFNHQVYEALAEHESAFCIFDFSGLHSPKIVTADFVYIRLHGPNGPYRGQYEAESLSGWANTFSLWVDQGKEIYCYFDNDEAGYAPQDALRLQKMVTV